MQGDWESCKGAAGMLGPVAVALPGVTFQRGRDICPSLFFHPPSAMGRDGSRSGCAIAQ